MSNTVSNSYDSDAVVDLDEYLGVIRRRRNLIIVSVVIGAILASIFSQFQRPVYESTANVWVRPTTTDPLSPTRSVDDLVNLDTERQLARSVRVIELALIGLASDEPLDKLLLDLGDTGLAARADELAEAEVEDFRQNVVVEAVSDTQVLRITAFAGDGEQAAAKADAVGQAYLAFKGSTARRALDDRSTSLTNDIVVAETELDGLIGADDDASLLRQQLLTTALIELERERRELEGLEVDPGLVIDPAEVPAGAASPNLPMNLAAGVLLGGLFGVALAFIRDRTDDRIEGRDDLDTFLGLPVHAAIPVEPRGAKGTPGILQFPDGGFSDAHRRLRGNVLFQANQENMRILMVASPQGTGDQSTTVSNLAVSLAQVGNRVLVVSVDYRDPTLHHAFGVAREPGLTEYMAAGAAAEALNLRAPEPDLRLRLLTTGYEPRRPAELLQSSAFDRFLREQTEVFDFILLDAPAVLDVADALAVAPKADGVLLVAHRREATRDSIVRAHEQLERVGGRVSGVVITDGKETDLISVGGPSSSSEGGASDAGRRLLDMVRRGGGE